MKIVSGYCSRYVMSVVELLLCCFVLMFVVMIFVGYGCCCVCSCL